MTLRMTYAQHHNVDSYLFFFLGINAFNFRNLSEFFPQIGVKLARQCRPLYVAFLTPKISYASPNAQSSFKPKVIRSD